MSSIEKAREELYKLSGKDRFEVMAETTAIITELMEAQGLKPIVVGGLAVEIYTRGQYTTLDIDLVTKGREIAGDILINLGFLREGRHWYQPELGVAIEIPDSKLEGADEGKIIRLELPSGRYLYVIGIEDIILDRLRACVHWTSSSDCEWGLRMLKVHLSSSDLNYMKEMAEKDHSSTAQKLDEWLKEMN